MTLLIVQTSATGRTLAGLAMKSGSAIPLPKQSGKSGTAGRTTFASLSSRHLTDAMLQLAEQNRQEAGIENVRFLKGVIEAIPLPAESVDVVISNCVINLSADKGQVLREAYRVLVAGGRFAVSDIVFRGQLPSVLRRDLEAWAGCIAGAPEEETYRALLHQAAIQSIACPNIQDAQRALGNMTENILARHTVA